MSKGFVLNENSKSKTNDIRNYVGKMIRKGNQKETAKGKCSISILQEDGTFKQLTRAEALEHYSKKKKGVKNDRNAYF